VLGTVEAPDGRQLTVADVPGLIEGASRGVGLGHEFLAHLERARLLLHVIDAATGEPDERFRTIERELERYGAGLAERPQAVVLNKIDLLQRPAAFELADPRVVRVFRVSCATGEGIDGLKHALFELCPAEPELPADVEELPEFLEYRPRPAGPRYRVLKTDRGFRVVGDVPMGDELEAALRAAGVRRGAEVEIGDEVLVWE
jgi:GTP-binding protein